MTVVPGGATRLTENPIIKMAVAKLCVGIGITPVVQRESAVHAFLEPDLANIEIGCWYQCELSAHYHNKKLVAWEPLLEPWTIEGQLGCDITRVSNKDPLLLSSGNFGSAASAQPASAFSSFLHTRRFSSLISTLQSVSSYATPSSGGDEVTGAEEGIILSSSSASYALLLFSGENVILSALLPEREAGGTSFGYSYTRQYARDWLSLFGVPQQLKRTERQPTQQCPCFSLQLRDHGPMNVNLTGAILSDAIGLLSAELKSSSKKQAAAPTLFATRVACRFASEKYLMRKELNEENEVLLSPWIKGKKCLCSLSEIFPSHAILTKPTLPLRLVHLEISTLLDLQLTAGISS